MGSVIRHWSTPIPRKRRGKPERNEVDPGFRLIRRLLVGSVTVKKVVVVSMK